MHLAFVVSSLVLATISQGRPIAQLRDVALTAPGPVDTGASNTTSAINGTDVSTAASSFVTAFTLYTTFPASAIDTALLPLPTDNSTDASSTNSSVTSTSTSNDTLSATATATDSAATPFITDTSDLSPTSTSNDTAVTVTVTNSSALPDPTAFIMPTNIPPACMAIMASSTFSLTASLPSSTASFNGSDSLSTFSSSFSSDNVTALAAPSGNLSSIALSTASVTDSAASAASTASASTSDNSTLSSSLLSALPSATATPGLLNFTDPGNETLSKRIAQADLPDVAQSWQDLCLVSGGDIFTNEPCVNLAGINGINALLASADPCDQQDNADAMIDFAKSAGVNNTDALIANAIAYRQHARNALNINGIVPSTPYCQTPPRNAELQGVVNAQLPGVNPGVFGGPSVGLVAFGDPSSCPLGSTPDVTTCGCS